MTIFENVVEHYVKEREFVVWGIGNSAKETIALIEKMKPIKCFLAKDIGTQTTFQGKPLFEAVDYIGQNHTDEDYFIILSHNFHTEMAEVLNLAGYTRYIDYYDWFENRGYYPFPTIVEAKFEDKIHHVEIGKYSYIPHETWLGLVEHVGAFTTISQNVYIANNHQMNMITTNDIFGFEELLFTNADREKFKKLSDSHTNKLRIGNDVWIGTNVFINVSKVAYIGDGAVIGSNSLVIENVPPYAVVYGQPAKVKKFRFADSEIDLLLKEQWWNWSDKMIRERAGEIMNPKEFFDNSKRRKNNEE